jgi:hypothetical protein
MSPRLDSVATRWAPVESDATALHVWPVAVIALVRSVHVTPESVEVQMSPLSVSVATRWVPVESDATAVQLRPVADDVLI